MELLRDLLALDEIEAVETREGLSLPHLEIRALCLETDSFPVHVRKRVATGRGTAFDSDFHAGIDNAGQCLEHAERLAGRWGDSEHPEVRAALADILVYEAHRSLRNDLLVTRSPWLTAPAHVRSFRDANPCGPLEALRLVGLYLRACDVYTVTNRGLRINLTRSSFYETLTELRVPSLPTLIKGLSAGIRSRSDTGAIARSVRIRCERALQARDEIAQTFYCSRQARSLADATYHFDYLALLLQGAFDGLARIANRAWRVGFKQRGVAFHHKEFRNALRSAGAAQLHDLIVSDRATSLLHLLGDLRNTIHEATLESFGRMMHGNEGWTRILLTDNPLSEKLWDRADQLGGAEGWGLSKMHDPRIGGSARADDVLLEVYPCASELTQQSLALVDEVAATVAPNARAGGGGQSWKYRSLIGAESDAVRESIDLLGA